MVIWWGYLAHPNYPLVLPVQSVNASILVVNFYQEPAPLDRQPEPDHLMMLELAAPTSKFHGCKQASTVRSFTEL